ncbi:hypothetical protein I3843_Q017000 [Carya illinoinensis]|nr:hypothetical protein I3843_Q017000 [Carya illinoinensis]
MSLKLARVMQLNALGIYGSGCATSSWTSLDLGGCFHGSLPYSI